LAPPAVKRHGYNPAVAGALEAVAELNLGVRYEFVPPQGH
jgi:TRAP-type uncharacterized transport system fused permease subunit